MLESYIFDSSDLFLESSNTEEVILQIPPEICEKMNWKEGDVLKITVEDNSIVLRKKE